MDEQLIAFTLFCSATLLAALGATLANYGRNAWATVAMHAGVVLLVLAWVFVYTEGRLWTAH